MMLMRKTLSNVHKCHRCRSRVCVCVGGGGQVPCWSALEQDLAPFQNKSLSLKYSSFVVDVVVVLLLNSLTSSVHVASYKSGLINEWIN